MQVAGVNFLIPHSFNPRAPDDTDCPPYFYNGGQEPRYPLYRVWADYTNRLSLMLRGGRHACPVAFLFLGHSHQVGKSITPENMTTALQDALSIATGCPTRFSRTATRLDGKELQLRQERYKVLIVPPGRSDPVCDARQGQAVLRARGRRGGLRLAAQQVGDSGTHERGYRGPARGDLGRPQGARAD